MAEHELHERAVTRPVFAEHVQRAVTDLVEVAPCPRGVEQRQLAADRARCLEGVVERRQLGMQQRAPPEAVA